MIIDKERALEKEKRLKNDVGYSIIYSNNVITPLLNLYVKDLMLLTT